MRAVAVIVLVVAAAARGMALGNEVVVGQGVGASVQRGDGASAAIDACIRRLDPDFDVGYERIAGRCPELTRRLEESGWSAWLPRDWKQAGNDLSAGSLIELRVLIERELATRAGGQLPDVERLHPVLAGLGQAGPEGESWWERLKSWVREAFERTGSSSPDSDLSRMVAAVGLSQAVIEIVSYVALALVVVLTLFIVSNEVRSAGVFRRVWRGSRPGRSGALVAPEPLGWRDVENADLERKPAVLLEVIAASLAARECLPPPRGLTVRELTSSARFFDESDRERLAQLALVVESLRFSDQPVPPDSIQRALAAGRELLNHLGPGTRGEVEAGGRA